MKLIPKYQKAGLVARQDNTYVAKPAIPIKPIKRTYIPTQSYVSQDNRTEWQREQSNKQANEEYKKYMEDKKMQQGLDNLNGFLNFVDAATIATGAGSLAGKGLRLGGKKVANQLVKRKIKNQFGNQLSKANIGDILRESGYIAPSDKSYKLPDYATPNSSTDPIDLHATRLMRGGYRNLPETVNGEKYFNNKFFRWPYKSKSMFHDVYYYDRNPREWLDNIAGDFNTASKVDVPVESLYDLANKSANKESTFATSGTGNVYVAKNGMFKIVNDFGANNVNRTISHEIDHAIHIPGEVPKGFGSTIEYFTNKNGTELAARGSQIKDYFGLSSPKQEITEDMLRYAAKNYAKDTGMNNNMTEFFNSITDWKEAAKWLSKWSSMIAVPVMIKTNDYANKDIK